MENIYKSIHVLGRTLDDAISILLEYRSKGELACLEFNGVTLYSDTVEIDKAYSDITSISKLEFDKKYNNKI